MTQRKKQNAKKALTKDLDTLMNHKSPKMPKKGGWGAEPVELDDEEDTPAPTPVASDPKAMLQKIEAELAAKRKVVAAEQAKLTPLETEAKKLRDAIHRSHANVIADNIDTLLLVVPEHERTSCSDEDPSNEGRCTRCNLLYIKENRWDAANFKFEVTVSPR